MSALHYFTLLVMLCLMGPSRSELTLQDGPLGGSYADQPLTDEIPADQTHHWFWALGGGVLLGSLLFGGRQRRRNRSKLTVGVAGILCTAGLTSLQSARACMNLEMETLEQRYVIFNDTEWFSGSIRRAFDTLPKRDPHVKPNPNAYATPPPPGTLENDEAVRLVLRGDVKGALNLLQQVESEHPGMYSTAANLGSCYELNGEDQLALQWIREGISRNPAAHMIAEWLHVAVLEAKLALKENPNWLDTHTISGLDPKAQQFETLQGTLSRMQVLKSYRSQCTVRALFIKSNDPVMQQLLYEAATFLLADHPHAVKETLKLAEFYGPKSAKAETLRMRAEARLDELLALERTSRAGLFVAKWKYPFICLLTSLITFLLLIWRNQRKADRVKAALALRQR